MLYYLGKTMFNHRLSAKNPILNECKFLFNCKLICEKYIGNCWGMSVGGKICLWRWQLLYNSCTNYFIFSFGQTCLAD